MTDATYRPNRQGKICGWDKSDNVAETFYNWTHVQIYTYTTHIPEIISKMMEGRPVDFLHVPALVACRGLYPLQLATHVKWAQKNSAPSRPSKDLQTHLNTTLVLFPDLPALRIEFIRLLLWVRRARFRGRACCDGWFQIAFKPGIETSVVLLLERCAFWGETLWHGWWGSSERRRWQPYAALVFVSVCRVISGRIYEPLITTTSASVNINRKEFEINPVATTSIFQGGRSSELRSVPISYAF